MENIGIFDTHCHLMSKYYQQEEVILLLKAAYLAKVRAILNVGYDLKTSKKAVFQVYEYENEQNIPNLYAAVGIHPTEVGQCDENTIKQLTELIQTGKVIAVGEIGLDYFHKITSPASQKKWFKKQLLLAKHFNLPVLLHIRDAFEDAYQIIVELNIKYGLLHCFTGSKKIAEKFLALGFYISFAGNLTYKNAKVLQEIIPIIPNNRILVETDAPYLTPEPLRGKKPLAPRGLTINKPANIIYTIKKIAQLKNISSDNIAIIIKILHENALNLFNLK